MHGIEGDFVAFIGCQPVDEDLLTFLNFELLTGDGNNCEHIENQKFGGNNKPFFKKAGKGTSTRLKNQAGFEICHFAIGRHCVIRHLRVVSTKKNFQLRMTKITKRRFHK